MEVEDRGEANLIAVDAGVEIHGIHDAPRSEVRRWVKAGFFTMADGWHRKVRRGHFALSARSKYNYTPRSRTYNTVKRKAVGHTIPLVLSGTSRDLSETKKVTATSKEGRVRMPVRVFNFRTAKSKVDKRKEFTTVLPQERNVLSANAHKTVEQKAQRYENESG